jgi:hypothetical protein
MRDPRGAEGAILEEGATREEVEHGEVDRIGQWREGVLGVVHGPGELGERDGVVAAQQGVAVRPRVLGVARAQGGAGPAMLTGTIDLPRCCLASWEISRKMISVAPPGPKGITRRISCSG